jgi:hypothetical protein
MVSDTSASLTYDTLHAVVSESYPIDEPRAYARTITHDVHKSIDFGPLYRSSITGDIDDGGFIE